MSGLFRVKWPAALLMIFMVLSVTPTVVETEEGAAGGQDRESMALDSTATQWSFQFAYQIMPSYCDDIIDGGQMRPAGKMTFCSCGS